MRSFEPATIVIIVMRSFDEEPGAADVRPTERTAHGPVRSMWVRGRDRRSAGSARHRPTAGWDR